MARYSSRFGSKVRTALFMAAFAALTSLSGCAGGGTETSTPILVSSDSPTTPTTPVTQETINGVATPDSVSVVTATNAG